MTRIIISFLGIITICLIVIVVFTGISLIIQNNTYELVKKLKPTIVKTSTWNVPEAMYINVDADEVKLYDENDK